MRTDDALGRLGGDEFGLLLPHTDGDAAERVARRVAEQLGGPGVSHGVARYPEDGITAAAVYAAADRRLYEVKRTRTATPTPA